MQSLRVVNGSNVQAQIRSIDTILARLTRRRSVHKNYFVSPLVFSAYVLEVPEDLAILRFMPAVEGKLIRIVGLAETIPENVKGGELSVEVHTKGVTRKDSVWAKKGKGIIDDDKLDVYPDSQVSVKFSEPTIGNIWVSALVAPNIDARFIHSQEVTGDE